MRENKRMECEIASLKLKVENLTKLLWVERSDQDRNLIEPPNSKYHLQALLAENKKLIDDFKGLIKF